MIYLDNAATTKPYYQALSEFNEIQTDIWMNPSSSSQGSKVLSDSRQIISEILNCKPKQIRFTSGSTEAANWVLRQKWDHIITSPLEHPCVYETAVRCANDLHFVRNGRDGKIDIVNLTELLDWCSRQGGTTLVAIMGANNELSTIQPVAEIGEITHYYSGAYYFCDATQLWPHEQIDTAGIDFACMSAHKFGGLKGSGFLYARDPELLTPLLFGGHQEGGLRAGTENVGGIAAMAKALEITERLKPDATRRAEEIRAKILSLSDRVNSPACSVKNIVSITLPDCNAQDMVAALTLDEIYISAGSACSSGDSKPSRVLLAAGMTEEEAKRTIRISFDAKTRPEDIETLFKRIEYYRGVLS